MKFVALWVMSLIAAAFVAFYFGWGTGFSGLCVGLPSGCFFLRSSGRSSSGDAKGMVLSPAPVFTNLS